MTLIRLSIISFFVILGLTGCKSKAVSGAGSDVITDLDGNQYQTVKIGEQTWMAEDLKVTRLNDGSAIPVVTGYEDWAEMTTPAYCWYNNDSTTKDIYGALYNWYTVQSNKLCPRGWHVPSDEEWNELMSFFGDPGSAGKALKATGTTLWRNPNLGATNESGFSGLPGGYRSYNGTFNLQRAYAYWWTSTPSNWWGSSVTDPTIVYFRNLRYDNDELYRYVSEVANGFCVRCLMD